MMDTKCTSWVIWLLVIGLSSDLCSQDSKILESKRQVIEKQIDLTNQILEKTKRNKKSTIHDYKAIRSQIENRQNLISDIRSELDSTDTFIKNSNVYIDKVETNVDAVKLKYDQILRSAYRQKLTQNTLLQLLASKSLKEALLKWRYTKQFEQYCKKQIALLQRSKLDLKTTLDTIVVVQKLKQSLLEEERKQNDLLGSELEQKNKLIKSLESNEKMLYAELSKQNLEKQNMNRAISNIIAGYTSADDIKPSTQQSSAKVSNTITPRVSTKSFTENKGFLAWPVEEGFIINKFGKQRHPTLPDVEIDNNGIDIRTTKNAKVNAVHDGIVVGRSFIPGNYNVLVIRHGEYLTVYSRLEEAFVKKGDQVYSGQNIGKVVTEDGVSMMHFEVWNNKQKENPAYWIQRK